MARTSTLVCMQRVQQTKLMVFFVHFCRFRQEVLHARKLGGANALGKKRDLARMHWRRSAYPALMHRKRSVYVACMQ